MTDWTTLVVGQFISGRAFFFGIALCLLGCFLKLFFKRTLVHALARITLLTGVVLVVLSAAPFSLWVYGVFFALLAWAVIRIDKARARVEKSVCFLPLLLLLAQTFLIIGMELRRSMPPNIQLGKSDTLFVVGDSISMGADPPGKNWPELLGDLAKLKVRNFSFGGAKVESSLDNARRINRDDAVSRGISSGDIVRVFNDRGAILAGAVVSEEIRRGVVQMSTGAWYDPEHPGVIGSLDKHANPNVLTLDKGTSRLAQGPSAQTTLVEIEKFVGEPPTVSAFDPPI